MGVEPIAAGDQRKSLQLADEPPGGRDFAEIPGDGTRAELEQQLARLRPHDDLELDVTRRPAGGRGVVENEPRRVPIPNGIDRLARLALQPKAGQLDLARARAVVAEHQRQLVGPGELAEV